MIKTNMACSVCGLAIRYSMLSWAEHGCGRRAIGSKGTNYSLSSSGLKSEQSNKVIILLPTHQPSMVETVLLFPTRPTVIVGSLH